MVKPWLLALYLYHLYLAKIRPLLLLLLPLLLRDLLLMLFGLKLPRPLSIL
jgi:hypothetical protein